MSRRMAAWALSALLGLVLTACITWATSQLTSQHIGISSEPVSVSDRLAPRAVEGARRSRPAAPVRTHSATTPNPPPSSGKKAVEPAKASPATGLEAGEATVSSSSGAAKDDGSTDGASGSARSRDD